MPSWGIHIYIARKISEKLNILDKEYIISNVLPDIYSGYIIENMPVTLVYDSTHYACKKKINNVDFTLPDFERFKKEYHDKINNLAVLGYYTHLITDYFFNYYSFKNKYIKNENGQIIAIKNKNGKVVMADNNYARISKQQDFAIFDYILLNSIDIENVELSDRLINDCLEIKNMNITSQDLQKVVNYINDMINNKKTYKNENVNKGYVMFLEEELYRLTSECIDFILEKIDKNIST